MILNCPLPAALTDIPVSNCPFRFDQIVRLAIRRRAGVPFTDATSMKLLASWTALISKTDDSKIIMSPIFTSLVIPSSEGTFTGGGDNSTFNGVREYYGEGPVTVTGTFRNIAPMSLNAMDNLAQESIATAIGLSNLEIFLINKDGVVFSSNLDGIVVYNFRVGSLGSEGLNAPNIAPFSFDLLPNWDRSLVATKVSFNPIVDLINPVVTTV